MSVLSSTGLRAVCIKSRLLSSSLCNLCVLCASVVTYRSKEATTETQRPQRLHRESNGVALLGQSHFAHMVSPDDFFVCYQIRILYDFKNREGPLDTREASCQHKI